MFDNMIPMAAEAAVDIKQKEVRRDGGGPPAVPDEEQE